MRDNTLGKYELQTELGRGAFATVYQTLDPTRERQVALKVLHPPLLTHPGFVRRFQQEAKLMANLRHNHICTVFEVAQSEGHVYIAMQLADGPSLAQAISERGATSLDETLEILAPLCQVLDYAYRQNIIHRDLKPANILLDQNGTLFLYDFGSGSGRRSTLRKVGAFSQKFARNLYQLRRRATDDR